MHSFVLGPEVLIQYTHMREQFLSTFDFELDTHIAGIHLVTDANAHT